MGTGDSCSARRHPAWKVPVPVLGSRADVQPWAAAGTARVEASQHWKGRAEGLMGLILQVEASPSAQAALPPSPVFPAAMHPFCSICRDPAL